MCLFSGFRASPPHVPCTFKSARPVWTVPLCLHMLLDACHLLHVIIGSFRCKAAPLQLVPFASNLPPVTSYIYCCNLSSLNLREDVPGFLFIHLPVIIQSLYFYVTVYGCLVTSVSQDGVPFFSFLEAGCGKKSQQDAFHSQPGLLLQTPLKVSVRDPRPSVKVLLLLLGHVSRSGGVKESRR